MRSWSTVLLLTANVVAQSIVFPSDHTSIVNGASSISWFPFSSGVSRMEMVFEDWDLGLPPNTAITRIGFRQDGAQTSVQRLVQMDMRMGITNATASTLGTNFDANFLGAPVTVYAQGLLTLPALNAATPNSIVWVNLTTPYTYPGGNLLVDFRIYSNNNGNQSFNYPLDRALFDSPVTAGVQGCLHSGNQRATLASNPTQIGGNWNLYLSSAPANTPIALFIAPSQPMLTTPYSLQVIGLDPACMGQLPLTGLASFSGSTNSGGGASWQVPVPNNLAFNDVFMSSQVVAIDFFSPGYLVTSNADQVQFGVAPASSILYAQGSATATTGSVYANYGVVTLFN